MDFQLLYRSLPQKPAEWSRDDVLTWLQFINLETLSSSFTNARISGPELMSLGVKELEVQLAVRSHFSRKKLLKWIQEGFRLYEKFVENKKKTEDLPLNGGELQIHRSYTSMMRDRVNNSHQQSVSAFEVGSQSLELLITPYQGQNASFFSINREAMIGKTSSHTISVFEVHSRSIQDSVDRDHARIFLFNKNFYLEDLGSKFGTYVRICQREPLLTNMILEMGSYLFVVVEATADKLTLLYSMNETDAQDVILDSSIGSKGYNIGRKLTANLPLDDQHMSGFHAKISHLGGQFVIEDMSSTNGTWIRFSKPRDKSSPYLLRDKTVFKIGSTSTYTCRLKWRMDIEAPVAQTKRCIGCKSPETDGLLDPCRHNVTCYSCALKLACCPVCSMHISACIKIFN